MSAPDNLRILGQYVRRSLLEWSAARSFVFTLVAQAAITPLIGLAVWSRVLPGDAGISVYYAALLFTRLLTVSYENHTFSSRIYSGDLAEDLLRPHPVVLAPLGENLAIRLSHLIMGVPLVLVIGLLLPAHPSPASLLLALPAHLMAAALQFLFTYTLALTAFWTQKAFGVVGVGQTLTFLLGGEAFPAWLAPGYLAGAIAVLPFRAMLGFPAEILAGRVAGEALLAGYLTQGAWVAVLLVAAGLTWRAGVRAYTAVGG